MKANTNTNTNPETIMTLEQIQHNNYIAPIKFCLKAGLMALLQRNFQLKSWENDCGEMVISAISDSSTCWLIVDPVMDHRKYIYCS